MALHIVQPNQSAAMIAQAYTGNPAREKELVRANLHKGWRQTRNGNLYFTSLQPGERLRLPLSWMKAKTVKNPMAKTTNGAVAQSRLQGLINSHNMGVNGVPLADVGQDMITSGPDDGTDSSGDSGDGSGTLTNQNLTNVNDDATVAVQGSTGTVDANGNLSCPAGSSLQIGSGGEQTCMPNSPSSGGGVTPGVNPLPSPSNPMPVSAGGGTDWLLWGGVALGVVAVGGGVYYFSKKGKHPAAGAGPQSQTMPSHKSTEMFYR